MNRKFNRTLGMLTLAAGLVAVAPGCSGDLDQSPNYQLTADQLYKDAASAQTVLARLYSTFAVTGQQGPTDQPDVTSIDEGNSNYTRLYWQAQEITTDEAVCGWSDPGIPEMNMLTWDPNNGQLLGLYARINYEISLCNEFVRQTTDDKLASRGVSSTDVTTMRQYRSEARLLRALAYWHLIDMYGGGPFTTEADAIGTLPPYKDRAGMFAYVESELRALDLLDASNGALLAPRATYARADQAVLWTLLTKLYLNAQVYTGTSRATDAITYAKKVLSAGYSLSPSYANLFLADNNASAARNEIIFSIAFDGLRTRTWGGTTYLVHAPGGNAFTAAMAGTDGGWSGLRTKPNLTRLFGQTTAPNPSDVRSSQIFIFQGQTPDIDDLSSFDQGPLVAKWRNVTSTGGAASNLTWADVDFPMFRLADVMLMYSEAVLRGGSGGDAATALAYVNQIRARSGVAATTAAALDLRSILDERGRELYWEGHRRTDLVRFSLYTKNNNWPFKGYTGGATSKAGQDVPDTRAIFPIPQTDRTANPNLPQNPGYTL